MPGQSAEIVAPGMDRILRGVKYPCRVLVSNRNKEDTRPGLAHSGAFLHCNLQVVQPHNFLGSRRGGSPVPA